MTFIYVALIGILVLLTSIATNLFYIAARVIHIKHDLKAIRRWIEQQ